MLKFGNCGIFLDTMNYSTTEEAESTQTVLVVDDEKTIVHVARSILEPHGYTVLSASNGKEAIDIANNFEGEIKVAVLDMAMPVMGGVEAFPHLRRACPGIKVIICSGYPLDDAAQSLIDSGANVFLQKPFKAVDLLTAVRNALER